LSVAAWWLPDVQVRFQKRRYARLLGDIARRMGELQPRIDGMVTTEELLLTDKGEAK
jgi:oligoribonuclease (3'-5' exoribonuclease)